MDVTDHFFADYLLELLKHIVKDTRTGWRTLVTQSSFNTDQREQLRFWITVACHKHAAQTKHVPKGVAEALL